MKLRLTFWKAVFLLLMAAGLVFLLLMAAGFHAAIVRFTKGLGAATHLSDQFPWGLWIGFDVLCGVMLAAGSFTLTAAVHILNIKRLKPIIHPTVLNRLFRVPAGMRCPALWPWPALPHMAPTRHA